MVQITLFDREGFHYSLEEHYLRLGREQSLNNAFFLSVLKYGFCRTSPKRCCDMRHLGVGRAST
jgi:hypothetical protein